jgi:hypothetical protein
VPIGCYDGWVIWPKQEGKCNARKATYNRHTYHSGREAEYAQELDWRVKAGELREWRRQVPIELCVGGKLICTYTIDFVEIDRDGKETWTEVKGFETPEWRLKWKLFEALYPDRSMQVVR